MQTKKIKYDNNKNGVQLATFAREKGISKKKFFVEFLYRDNWFQKLQASADKVGARIYMIPNLIVDYTKPIKEKSKTRGLQTLSRCNNLEITDKYQPSENKLIKETIVLFKWEKGEGNYIKAIEWGLSNNLRKTTPSTLLAIKEDFPGLNYKLGTNPMFLVETTGCIFKDKLTACYVFWRFKMQHSNLRLQRNFSFGNIWFSFLK